MSIKRFVQLLQCHEKADGVATKEDAMNLIRRTAVLTMYLVAVSMALSCPVHADTQKGPTPPDILHRQAADSILVQIWRAEPGGPKFDAINAVVDKYKQSDAPTQNAIVWLCLVYMRDLSRGILDRWPCCYVVDRCRYEPGIQGLIDVLFQDQSEAMRSVTAESLGEFFKATANATIKDALTQAFRQDPSKRVRDTIAKYLQQVVNPVPNPPDDPHRQAADTVLQQIWDAEPGGPKFDAINAVVQKYNQSDAASKNAITWLCLTYIKDKTRGPLDRWPCCYVIQRCKYEAGIPDLIDELLHDSVECMRSVSAESLGGFYKDTGNITIKNALIEAARTDPSSSVREVIAKYLGKDMPGVNSGA